MDEGISISVGLILKVRKIGGSFLVCVTEMMCDLSSIFLKSRRYWAIYVYFEVKMSKIRAALGVETEIFSL